MARRNRRQFLQDSMFATAAAAMANSTGRYLTAQDQPPASKSANERLNVACVGVNGRGGSHIGQWSAKPDTIVTYVVDVDSKVGNGRVNEKLDPLHDVRALKGISIDEGRLAWVTPPGQDGNGSSVQVLAWSGDDFGQVQTVPGEQLTIVH